MQRLRELSQKYQIYPFASDWWLNLLQGFQWPDGSFVLSIDHINWGINPHGGFLQTVDSIHFSIQLWTNDQSVTNSFTGKVLFQRFLLQESKHVFYRRGTTTNLKRNLGKHICKKKIMLLSSSVSKELIVSGQNSCLYTCCSWNRRKVMILQSALHSPCFGVSLG